MALYKYGEFLTHAQNEAFDQLNAPNTPALWPGIYRCHTCGRTK